MRCKSIKREFVCRSQSLWGWEPLPCHSGAANFLLLHTQTWGLPTVLIALRRDPLLEFQMTASRRGSRWFTVSEQWNKETAPCMLWILLTTNAELMRNVHKPWSPQFVYEAHNYSANISECKLWWENKLWHFSRFKIFPLVRMWTQAVLMNSWLLHLLSRCRGRERERARLEEPGNGGTRPQAMLERVWVRVCDTKWLEARGCQSNMMSHQSGKPRRDLFIIRHLKAKCQHFNLSCFVFNRANTGKSHHWLQCTVTVT